MGTAVTSTVDCTVVITNHDYGRFLGDAIRSALGQVGGAVQVVVVDDGSTDDSAEVIASFGDLVEPVLQANAGQGAAFNAGFARSRGRIVIPLDADDILEPDAAQVSAAVLAAERAVHVRWQMELTGEDGRPTGRLNHDSPPVNGDFRQRVREQGPAGFEYGASGNAFTADFLTSALPIPAEQFRTGIDFYLAWMAAASGPLAAAPRPLSRYRRHGSSDSVRGTTDERIDRGLRWAATAKQAVAAACGASPEQVASWHKHWWEHADEMRTMVADAVPPNRRVLLLDDYLWAARGLLGGREVLQFGAAGPPVDGQQLVDELEQRVAEGFRHLVLARFCTWWLDSYPELAQWLERHSRQVASTEAALLHELDAAEPEGRS